MYIVTHNKALHIAGHYTNMSYHKTLGFYLYIPITLLHQYHVGCGI